jgi:RNA polymerase sigma-70 factor (ECF subfamily)
VGTVKARLSRGRAALAQTLATADEWETADGGKKSADRGKPSAGFAGSPDSPGSAHSLNPTDEGKREDDRVR